MKYKHGRIDGGIVMERELQLIQDVFKTEVQEIQIDEKIDAILDWNSFMIMQLMAEISSRYQYDISVMEIAEIERLRDLVELIGCIANRERQFE